MFSVVDLLLKFGKENGEKKMMKIKGCYFLK